MNERTIGQWVSRVVTAIVVLILLFNCFTIVPAGHNKVGTLFGDVEPVPYAEGFNIVNPLVDFTEFDLRDINLTWKDISVPSQDKLKTSMDITLVFNAAPSKTPNMLKTVGDLQNAVDTYVTPKVRSLLREVGKSVAQSQDFFLEETQAEMQELMTTGLQDYLTPLGIQVKAVLFRDITLPTVVTQAVIQTKRRQEQLEQEKAQLEIVEQQAMQQVKQADAKALAAISEAEALRTMSDAKAYKIKVEAGAQAQANKKLSTSISTALIQFNRVERWDGVYPTTMLGASSKTLFNLK